MERRLVSDPRFEPEGAAFLKLLGPPEPTDHAALLESRASRPDPAIAGVPEPVAVRADVIVPLPEAPVRVRVYRNEAATPRPLLLWLHGGAFAGGTLDDIDVACAGLALRSGVTVLSLEYRLAPEHPYPAALHDTYDCLAWLREHGAAFGGDGRLLAGGQSSGANLVAAACLLARDRGHTLVDRQVLCYPWLEFESDSESHRLYDDVLFHRDDDAWFKAQYMAGQEVTPYVSPLRAPSLTGLPPALILGAGVDPVRDDARRYAQRMADDGVDATYLEYADTPHAFLNFPGALSAAWHAIGAIADDLTRFLGRP